MPFLELPRFPEAISQHARGGPGFLTNIVIVNSGDEFRNQVWAKERGRYEIGHDVRLPEQFTPLIAFFRVAAGRQNGFRFKDWADFEVKDSEGRFRTLTDNSAGPTFQLAKRYLFATAALSTSSTTSLAIAVGTKTFTVGAGLSFDAGMRVRANRAADYVTYMEGAVSSYTGTTLVLTIDVTSGTGTFADWDIALSGACYYREITKPTPKPAAEVTGGSSPSVDNMTGILTLATGTPTSWSGEFDVPCRFDTDNMEIEIIDRSGRDLIKGWKSVPIIEIRE